MTGEISPYDLQSPRRLILPRFEKQGSLQSVSLGLSGEAKIVRTEFDNGTGYVQVQVPCENLPHCNACECGSEHLVTITEEQQRAIADLLR